jgi:hypothetical protein
LSYEDERMTTSLKRVAARGLCGLLLAFVLAGGTKVAADSGGYYCGYGEASLYWDCENYYWHPINLGNGACRIELRGGEGCYVYLDGAGWTVDPIDPEFGSFDFIYTPPWLQ